MVGQGLDKQFPFFLILAPIISSNNLFIYFYNSEIKVIVNLLLVVESRALVTVAVVLTVPMVM